MLNNCNLCPHNCGANRLNGNIGRCKCDDKLKIGGVACVGTVPEYRKRGLGLKMVDMATVYLKTLNCDIAYIHYTHLEKWYKKLGYETVVRFSLS